MHHLNIKSITLLAGVRGVERRRIKMGRRKEVKDEDSRRRRRRKKGNQDQEMFL